MVDFQYLFLRPGEVVEPRKGYVYLDLGNRKEPGVVDHHFTEYEGDSFECTASLLVAEPSLVTEWISDEDLEGTVHLCVHTQPDFDCVASTWLVMRLLAAKASGQERPEGWGGWAPLVARTARSIDQGKTGIRLGEDGKPALSVYLAVLGVIGRVQESSRSAREAWCEILVEGHRLLTRAVELAVAQGRTDLGSLDLRGHLGELASVEDQVDRCLEAFHRDAARLGLVSGDAPRQPLDGLAEIDLPDRRELSSVHAEQRVAFLTDPESGGLFKSLIRGLYREEVQATCVFTSCPEDPFTGSPAWVRPIISVDPESPFSLRGLGRLLEIREKARRAELALPRVGPPRPGYDNPDPWFDGRSFDYTIVDAPNRGTVLAPREVREALLCDREWRRLGLEDVLGRAPQILRTPLLSAAERSQAFRALAGALVSLSAAETGEAETPRIMVAVEELLCALRRSDLSELDELVDLDALRPLAVGLLEHPDPAIRTWTLRRVVRGSWKDLETLLLSLDRGDLALVVRWAAACQLSEPEQVSLVGRLAGGRMSRERLALLDALAAFPSDLPPALRELARGLCARAGQEPAARESLLNLARELSGTGSPVEAWAVEAAESLAPAEKTVEPSLDDETAVAWRRGLCELATAEEGDGLHRHGRKLEAVFQARIQEGDLVGAARCLSLLSDREGLLAGVSASPEWCGRSQEEKTRRRERIAAAHRTVATRLTRLLLTEPELGKPERAHELTTSLAETLTRLLRYYGLQSVLADLGEAEDLARLPGFPTWSDLLARGTLDGPREWLLWKALEETAYPGGYTPSRIAARGPREHAFRLLLHRFARAAARFRSSSTDDTPAAVLPVLCRRLRPIVQERLGEWAEARALARVPELLDGVEELFRDPTSTAETSETPLCDLAGVVREELRYQLARTGLLEALGGALGRAEVLALGRRLLATAPESPPARIAGELIAWVLHLPAEDWRPRAEELLALRDQLPLEEPTRGACRRAAEAVEWAFSCLEAVVEGFEDEAFTSSPEAGGLRRQIRVCRTRLSEQPPGGLAWLLAVALEDVATYLERKLEVLERIERAKTGHDIETVAGLMVDVLESGVFDKLASPGRDAGTLGGERIRLQRAISAAGDCRDRGGGFSRFLSQAFRRLSRRAPLRSVTAGLETLAPPDPLTTEASEDKAYRRLKSLHPVDSRFTDRILQRTMTWLMDEYELDRARDLVDLHRLRPMGAVLRFWLSGYIVLLPAVFLPLFLASRVSNGWGVALMLEVLGIGVLALTGVVIGREVKTLMRGTSALSPHEPPHCQAAEARRQALLSRLTLQLFLPQLLTAMVVGVVGIAFTDELDARAAINLSDVRLLLLTVVIAIVSCEALGQLARHRGLRPSRRKLWIATARLFTYAFFMVMTLHFFLPPLLGVPVPPEKHPLLESASPIPGWPCTDPEFVPVCEPPGPGWIPLEIRTPLACGRIAYYPRHLMLYSALGMFAGIFVNVLFRGNGREPAS